MTTFHFQTHVPSSGVITFPPLPETFRGEEVTVKVDVNAEQTENDRAKKQERKPAFEELCDAWCADERSAEEIIRDIYESRTAGREREPL